MERCEQIKEISDRLIVDNEAVNKTIISINYSNNIKWTKIALIFHKPIRYRL